MIHRQCAIGTAFERAADKKDGDLVVGMAFASQEPYERWWGVEVLDVTPDSVRLGRLNDGAPLLYNHRTDNLLGTHVPGTVKADADGVLRGKVRITAATQAGRDAIGLVESGVLNKASVGYTIHKIVQQTTAKAADGSAVKVERVLDGAAFERLIDQHGLLRDGRSAGGNLAALRRSVDELAGSPLERAKDDEPDVYRIVDWEPFENSLVTIPADNTVGVGRSAVPATASSPPPAADAAPSPTTPSTLQKVNPTMFVKSHRPQEQATDGTTGSAAGGAASLTAVEAERERRQAILDLCKVNRIDSRVESRWVADGTPLSQVAKELLDVMEERGKAKPTAASNIGMSRSEVERFSLFRALRYLRRPSNENAEAAGFELEASRALAQKLGRGDTGSIFIPGEVLSRPLGEAATRAMSTLPGSKGGYMVDVENLGFIDILRNRSVCMQMGARRLSGLVGNITIPRQTGKSTVTWQAGEGVSVTASDQALGQLSMTPRTAIAITDVSEQLLRQATPSAEAFVMADLAQSIAIDGVDAAAINGTGGAQPLGIKNTTGIVSGQDASAATYAKILAFPAACTNAIRGNPGFVTNIAGAAVLMQKQRFTSTDTPLWEGNLLDGTCVGFRALSSEQLASGNIVFGSWDELVIGEWGVLELATDTGGTRFNAAQVGIRAMWMVDVLLRYPQAFVVGTNLAA